MVTGAQLVEVLRYALRALPREDFFRLYDDNGGEAIVSREWIFRFVGEAELFADARVELFAGYLQVFFGRNGRLQIGFPPGKVFEDRAQKRWIRSRLQAARDVLADPCVPMTHRSKQHAKKDEATYLEMLKAKERNDFAIDARVEKARVFAPRVRIVGLPKRFGPWRKDGKLRAFLPRRRAKQEIPPDEETEE